jgi:hypothetical protein
MKSRQELAEIVSGYSGIEAKRIVGKRRLRDYVKYRHMTWALNYRLESKDKGTNTALKFGVNHSSIIHGLKMHELNIDTDREYKLMYLQCLERLNLKLYDTDRDDSNKTIHDLRIRITELELTRDKLQKIINGIKELL